MKAEISKCSDFKYAYENKMEALLKYLGNCTKTTLLCTFWTKWISRFLKISPVVSISQVMSNGQNRWANCFRYWQCSHYILQIFKTCQEFIPSYSWHHQASVHWPPWSSRGSTPGGPAGLTSALKNVVVQCLCAADHSPYEPEEGASWSIMNPLYSQWYSMAHGEQSDLLSHSSMHFKPSVLIVFLSVRLNKKQPMFRWAWFDNIRILQMWHTSLLLGFNDAFLCWTCQIEMVAKGACSCR